MYVYMCMFCFVLHVIPGGINAELDDPEVTHLLVANGVDSMAIPLTIPSRIHIVKQQVRCNAFLFSLCKLSLLLILSTSFSDFID